MLATNLQRFTEAKLFLCPFCQEKLQLKERSLVCPQGHSFDLAKQGYVNLAPQAKKSDHYQKDSFQARQIILEAGFYDHILEVLAEQLKQLQPQTILDVACGEGFYSRQLHQIYPADYYAFDLAKESILLASKADSSKTIKWFVGDLGQIPLANQAFDVILDIYSPANYQEFQRLLRPGACLLKVIPGPQHLQEIRQILGKPAYDPSRIASHLEEAVGDFTRTELVTTYPLTPATRQALLDMTPLLQQIDQKQYDWEALTEITIAGTLYQARA